MTLLASCGGGRIGTTWIGGGQGGESSASRRRTRPGAISGNGVGSGGDLREIEMLEVADAIVAIGGSVGAKTVESGVADTGPLGEVMVGAREEDIRSEVRSVHVRTRFSGRSRRHMRQMGASS